MSSSRTSWASLQVLFVELLDVGWGIYLVEKTHGIGLGSKELRGACGGSLGELSPVAELSGAVEGGISSGFEMGSTPLGCPGGIPGDRLEPLFSGIEALRAEADQPQALLVNDDQLIQRQVAGFHLRSDLFDALEGGFEGFGVFFCAIVSSLMDPEFASGNYSAFTDQRLRSE